MGDDGLAVELRQDGPIPLHVAFGCRPGELIALVGPSGAGKTTVLRAIAGLYRPRKSQVWCAGETWVDTTKGVFRQPYERRVGLVFQSYALFPHLTALGDVEAALAHLPRRQRKTRLVRSWRWFTLMSSETASPVHCREVSSRGLRSGEPLPATLKPFCSMSRSQLSIDLGVVSYEMNCRHSVPQSAYLLCF
jgi:ABC-type sulfate/molybdate transport systems ATPase subunit